MPRWAKRSVGRVLLLLMVLAASARAQTTPPALVGTVDVGGSPYDLAVSPDGTVGLVTVAELNALVLIDLETAQPIQTLSLPGTASSGLQVEVAPDSAIALVTNYADQTAAVVGSRVQAGARLDRGRWIGGRPEVPAWEHSGPREDQPDRWSSLRRSARWVHDGPAGTSAGQLAGGDHRGQCALPRQCRAL